MAETDHGELLTKFEEMFGTLVEHEVIKLVLQSCGWNSNSASEMILGMIDQEELPNHIRTAVVAEAVVSASAPSLDRLVLPRKPRSPTPSRPRSPTGPTPSMRPRSTPTPSRPRSPSTPSRPRSPSTPSRPRSPPTDDGVKSSTDDLNYVEEILLQSDSSPARNDSPSFSVASESSTETLRANKSIDRPSSSSGSRSYSQNSTLTPFAMAQGTIANEPYVSSDMQQRPLSALPNCPAFKSEEREIVDVLPNEIDSLSDKESDTSLPHSPHKASAPMLDFDTIRARDTSQWVLAPEFVPNALHRSKLRSSVNGGIWPLRPNYNLRPDYNLTSINRQSTVPTLNSNIPSEVRVKSNLSKKDEVVNMILSGVKIMILMRGLPGSGKSSLAKEVKGHYGVILSTDDFFCDRHGRYIYDPSRIQEAHAWNKNRARVKLRDKRSPIIIDNTNLQIWEMKPYVKLALQNGYEVDILEPETSWKLSAKELAKRNTHGVPKEKIKEMKDRYDPSITIKHVIDAVGDTVSEDRARLDQEMVMQIMKKHGHVKTDWPTTLPEPFENEKPVAENGNKKSAYVKTEIYGKGYPLNEDLIPANKKSAQKPSDGVTPPDYCVSNSSLSYLEAYGGNDSEDDDDADVIIEGYEDLEDSGSGAAVSESVKAVVEGQSALHEQFGAECSIKESIERNSCGDDIDCSEGLSETFLSKEKIEKPHQENIGQLLPGITEEELSRTGCRDADDGVKLKNKEVLDEERIRKLVEEANMDTDDGHIEDWDDLVMDANEDELNDEKFNELVNDLGTSVKFELEKKFQGDNGDKIFNEDAGDFAEDTAMYDFCNNMEDKIGRSLSSVITRPNGADEPSSLFCVINACSLDVCKQTPEKGDEISEVRLSETNEISQVCSDEIENVIIISHNEVMAETNEIADCKAVRNESLSEENHKQSELSTDEKILKKEEFYRSDDECGLEEDLHKSAETIPVSDNTKEANAIDVTPSGKSSDLTKSENSTDTHQSSLSLTSWQCIDGKGDEISVNWDSSGQEALSKVDVKTSKPTRDNRRRTSGDPQKWMFSEREEAKNANDASSCAWEPVEEGAVASWEDTAQIKVKEDLVKGKKSQSHTGAVPKTKKKDVAHSSSLTCEESSPNKSWKTKFLIPSSPVASTVNLDQIVNCTKVPVITTCKPQTDGQTQTLSIDFQALEMDNNLYEVKILYGQPNYIPECSNEGMLLENGPLTKGKLSLDKGTMTENQPEDCVGKPLKNLVQFFPNIPEAALKDVLEKCTYDLDWTMNVLLDSGYEMAESVGICDSQEGSEEAMEDMETNFEANSTSEDTHERLTLADSRGDIAVDISEEKIKRLKQSQLPDDLVCKREIENAFTFSETVDDRVTRLTGKDFDNLNLNKAKHKKSKKKHMKRKHGEGSTNSAKEVVNWEEGEGAQYITLVMDSLFASQLVSMFGPIGSCGMSGDMASEDRSVILPLELCHQIHKYWTKTLDGKFNHEDQVLDSLIREDEILARRLQEEEELASKNTSFNANSSSLDNSEKVFQLDPPTNFKEIMNLEQALLQSQGHKNGNNEASLSSHLNLQRLYTEYPHVDREALKQEFVESGFNYQDTVKRISNRYGCEQGAPKTVIAPELLQQYEQQMVQKAKQLSLAQQEIDEAEHHEEEDIQPDNPQVYRDEAQTHYNQRQEYYRKAQEAHRQGMKAVAAYYANIGKLHSEKLNEANQRASLKILEAVNAKRDANALDLHLLHVPEALSATHAFLSEREQLLTARNISQMQVSLITGRGVHSIGGQARLKPAIKDFLQNKGYLFHEANSGMFVVTLVR